MAVNTLAPMPLTREFAPAMAARGSGLIVTIGSLAGTIASAGAAPYAASKWGVRGWVLSTYEVGGGRALGGPGQGSRWAGQGGAAALCSAARVAEPPLSLPQQTWPSTPCPTAGTEEAWHQDNGAILFVGCLGSLREHSTGSLWLACWGAPASRRSAAAHPPPLPPTATNRPCRRHPPPCHR